MTRRHFEWAAAELAEDRITGTFDPRESRAIQAFCLNMFRHFNSRFDRDRFESKVNQLIERALVERAQRRQQLRLVERAERQPQRAVQR